MVVVWDDSKGHGRVVTKASWLADGMVAMMVVLWDEIRVAEMDAR